LNHRKDTAKKRRPEAGFVELEMEDLSAVAAVRAGAQADEAFYRAWAADLLETVLSQIREEYLRTARDGHWRVFEARVLAPILRQADAPPLEEICRACGIEDEVKASNMVVTVKRRFQAVLRQRLRDLVPSEGEVELEFHEILRILSQPAQDGVRPCE